MESSYTIPKVWPAMDKVCLRTLWYELEWDVKLHSDQSMRGMPNTARSGAEASPIERSIRATRR